MKYKLIKKILIKGQITAKTGIAIGGSNTAMGIGGVDKGVIRNPITQQPYIPGSTLKGKMRSLLEIRNGEIGDKAMGAVKNGACERDGSRSANLFGNASGSDKQRPSRLIVRDSLLDGNQVTDNYFKDTDLLFTEVKTEVVIDRITSKAMPRQLERVPAGAKFDFELVLNIMEEWDKDGNYVVQKDDEKQLLTDVFASLQLVQDDYIGGSGSRGSGQICFDIHEVTEFTNAYYSMEMEDGKRIGIIPRTAEFKNIFHND